MWDDDTLLYLENAYQANRRKQQEQQQQPRGGKGFLGGLVDSIVTPSARFINQAGNQLGTVIDTGKMISASQTNNSEAFANAQQQATDRFANFKDSGGFLNKGTITDEAETRGGYALDGAKKIGGTTAQIASLLVPAGKIGTAGQIAKGALGGGLYGGGEALAEDRSLEDAISQSLIGAGTGGALGGVFAGGGKIASKLSGRGGAATGTTNELLTGSALKKAAKGTAGANSLDRQGRELYRATLGVDDILTPGKTKPLSIFKADELVDEAIDAGLRGSPEAMQRQAALRFQQIGSEVDNLLSQSKGTAPIVGKQGIFRQAESKIARDLPLKVDGVGAASEMGRVRNELMDFATNGQIDASGVNQFKQRLSSRLSPAFEKLATGKDLTMKELVDMSFWKEADNLIAQLAPEAKDLTMKQSRIYGLANGLATQTRSLGQPTSFFEAGARIAGKPIQSAQNLTGRALMGAGNVGSPTSGITGNIGRFVTPTTAGAAQGALTAGATQNFNQPQVPTSLEDALMQSEDGFGQEGGFGEAVPESSPYSRENLMADIQRDPKNADKYIETYASLQKVYAPPEGAELTASQETRAAAAQNALRDISLIEGAISSGKLGGLKNLPGSGTQIGRRLLGTEDLDAALFNVADNILRARSGAATPPEEVKRFAQSFLPSSSDSAEAKKKKLERAVRELQGYVNPAAAAGGGGGGQRDLVEALMQQQGSY